MDPIIRTIMVSSKRYSQKINAHLNAAKSYAELSYAKRLKVGAVIVRDDRVISIGYNGTPSGRDNNCEVWIDEKGTKRSTKKFKELPMAVLETKPEVCHAEMNAIMFAAKHGVSTDGTTLIVTHSPCYECSKMIVQCGIREVYYEEEYRDQTAVQFLKECNILVRKIS